MSDTLDVLNALLDTMKIERDEAREALKLAEAEADACREWQRWCLTGNGFRDQATEAVKAKAIAARDAAKGK